MIKLTLETDDPKAILQILAATAGQCVAVAQTIPVPTAQHGTTNQQESPTLSNSPKRTTQKEAKPTPKPKTEAPVAATSSKGGEAPAADAPAAGATEEAPEATPEEKPVTASDIRLALAEIEKQENKKLDDAIFDAFQEFGIATLGELKKDQYEAFYAALQKIGG